MVVGKSPACRKPTTGLTTLYLLWVTMETVPYSALGNLKKASEKLRVESWATEVASGLSQWDITLEITHKRSSFGERENESVFTTNWHSAGEAICSRMGRYRLSCAKLGRDSQLRHSETDYLHFQAPLSLSSEKGAWWEFPAIWVLVRLETP